MLLEALLILDFKAIDGLFHDSEQYQIDRVCFILIKINL